MVPRAEGKDRRIDHRLAALRAGANRGWDPPTVNEQVILFSPSGQLANGVVITGLPSDHIPANDDRPACTVAPAPTAR